MTGKTTETGKRRADHAMTWALMGLVALAFLLRVAWLTQQSLWRDEVDALRFATQPLIQLLGMFRRPGENGPLFFLTLRPWLAVAGQSEFALRFPSAFAGTLAVPLCYQLVRRLGGHFGYARAIRRPAILTALLVTTAPYLLWYGQEAKMYAALTALIPLSLLLALEASRSGRWWRWLLLYVFTSLSFYTHLLAVLAVPVQALWLLWLPRGARTGPARRAGLLYLMILLLPYLPLAWWQVPVWLGFNYRTGHLFVPLHEMALVLLTALARGILPVYQRITLLPAIFLISVGLVFWALPGDRRDVLQEGERRSGFRLVLLLALWLVLPLLELYLVSLSSPIFLDRYLIWIFPAAMALAALGAEGLAQFARPLGLLTVGAMLTLYLISGSAQNSRPIKSDFRTAAQFVSQHQQPDDLLVFQIPYSRYTFSYYAGEKERWMEGPFTNNGALDAAGVAGVMTKGTQGVRAVWLVASEVTLWDEGGLTQNWLETHGTVTNHASFERVSVTRYLLR